jgi:hypothetical protein
LTYGPARQSRTATRILEIREILKIAE